MRRWSLQRIRDRDICYWTEGKIIVSDVYPDPVGSAFVWVRGSGSRGIQLRKILSLTNKIRCLFFAGNFLLDLFFLLFPSFYTSGSGSTDPNECGSDRIRIQITDIYLPLFKLIVVRKSLNEISRLGAQIVLGAALWAQFNRAQWTCATSGTRVSCMQSR